MSLLDAGPGERLPLKEIREALRKDKRLLEIMEDDTKMQQYRDDYHDMKEEESKEKVRRVSSKSMAQVALKTHDLLQAQVCFSLLSFSLVLTICASVIMHLPTQVQTPIVVADLQSIRQQSMCHNAK